MSIEGVYLRDGYLFLPGGSKVPAADDVHSISWHEKNPPDPRATPRRWAFVSVATKSLGRIRIARRTDAGAADLHDEIHRLLVLYATEHPHDH